MPARARRDRQRRHHTDRPHEYRLLEGEQMRKTRHIRSLRWTAFIVLLIALAACSNNPGLPPVQVTTQAENELLTVSVDGDIIAFVDFYLDDALSPFAHDVTAPFEATLDTSTVPAGDHELRVVVTIDVLNDASTVTRYIKFTASGSQPAPTPGPEPQPGCAGDLGGLLVSTSADRSNPEALSCATVNGNIYVFTERTDAVSEVRFYLDDASMSSTPMQVDSDAPFDLWGSTSALANPFDTSSLVNGDHTLHAAISLTSGAVVTANATFTVNNQVGSEPLPPPDPSIWQAASIGLSAGNYSYSAGDGAITVNSSGYDIWSNSDNFYYVYQQLEGDSQLVVRVDSLQNTNAWAKAGIMFRESLAPSSRNVALVITPQHGVAFQTRPESGSYTESLPGTPSTAPHWIKLVRSGNTITGFESADGNTWTRVGSTTMALPNRFLIGLAVVSHAGGVSTQAHFSNLDFTGTATPTPDPTPDPTPAPTPPPTPTGNQPALLQAYWHNVRGNNEVLHETELMRYRPRQAREGLIVDERYGERALTNLGRYLGWDVLITDPNGSYSSYPVMDFTLLRLNRAARVAVVLANGTMSDLPSWLQGWSRGQDVNVWGRPQLVFEKTLPAGDNYLGTVEGKASFYTVLLAEENSSPTSAPNVPAGLQRPQANETCPAWVHDQYTAEGPDGKLYRTWHPQIDPVYWCYFEHEHGSNPALFSGYPEVQPLFNYYSEQTGQIEPHNGYKVLVIDETNNDVSAMYTIHGGTAGQGRACTRYHGFDWAFADKNTGEILADLRFKADFGYSIGTYPGFVQRRLRPDNCPEVFDLPNTLSGRRNIPVLVSGEKSGYESWQVDLGAAGQLPFHGSIVTVFDNPMARCADDMGPDGIPRCNSVQFMGGDQDGTFRWFIIPGSEQGKTFGIDAHLTQNSGVFYTDPFGRELRNPGDPDAVRQYIRPGAFVEFGKLGAGKFAVIEPWDAVYVHVGNNMSRLNRNIENQVPIPGVN